MASTPLHEHQTASPADARSLPYRLADWGQGYFAISEQGQLLLCCDGRTANLYQLVQQLRQQGQPLPLLIRCTDILRAQVDALHQAFQGAMREQNYSGHYTLAYPLKVNHQRAVIDTIARHPLATGLEVGSKAELLAALALAQPDSMVICNGYKDLETIRLALIGCRMGLAVRLVIEKPAECARIIQCVRELGVAPALGIRVKLHAAAAGRWQDSGGMRSRFGLRSRQIISVAHELQEAGLLDRVQLMHFHIGSQITSLQDFRLALREAARYYVELRKLGLPLRDVDVGGGLGVDYEGSQSTAPCSSNYSWRDYADSIVSAFLHPGGNMPCPNLISESGRAITAHHALLVSNVAETEGPGSGGDEPIMLGQSQAPAVVTLRRLAREGRARQARALMQQSQRLFALGRIGLPELAEADGLYHELCAATDRSLARESSIHVGNFSLFRSLPDSWAIGQVFPVMPIHRLREATGQQVILHDLSCDSKGRISRYVTDRGLGSSLPVPATDPDQEQLIGVFLLGAYQEALGAVHNLFGETGSVNISLGEAGQITVDEQHGGDRVGELLQRAGMDTDSVRERYQQRMAGANLSAPLRRQYLDELLNCLEGHSYLKVQ